MPIYEFECAACGQVFEELVRSQEAPQPACPACHAQKTAKLPSCASFRSATNPSQGFASPHSPPNPASSRRGCGPCSGGNCASCH